jgi:hypothetical protein
MHTGHSLQLLGDLLDARLPCTHVHVALSPLGKRHTAHWPGVEAAEFIRLVVPAARQFCPPHPTTPPTNPTRRAGCKVISWAPHSKTPPASPVSFSFSSLIPTIYRPAASTACSFSSFLPATSPRKFCIAFTTVRTYASAKKPKMPPKKAVKEEKVLLGRPGNSLKSGIVSESPAWCGCRVLTLTVVARSA